MEDRWHFRAWNPLTKEMMEPFHLIEVPKFFDELTGTHYELEFGMPHVKLMQCTGLKDKNGKLIYESDICKWQTDAPHESGIIKWVGAGFRLCYSGDPDTFGADVGEWGYDFEVVGNIYENPELLEAHDK